MRKILKVLSEHKRIVFIVVVIVVLLLIHNRLSVPRTPSQGQLQFTEVKRQDLKSTISTSGIFTGKDTADLHFKGSGKLAFINVKAGDQVHTGQTLAGLDTQDLSISLQQVENTLRDKQATVDKVLDDIHLFQYGNGGFSNVGSDNETETQKQLRTSAEVARDNAVDSIKAAKVAFQDSFISSPIPGIVTKADILPGEIASATDTIEVVDFSQPVFQADIDESDITKISAGQKAEVTLNAYGDKVFPGTVSEITSITKTTSSGATIVPVKITLADTSIQKVSGLNGQVNIILEEQTQVLTIPQEALRDDNTVFVQTSEGARPVKVTPGLRSETEVEIKEGLKEGDRVVTNPPAGELAGRSPGLLRIFRPGRR